MSVSRRALLQAGGGLVVACWVPSSARGEAPPEPFRPNAYLAVWPDGRLQFVLDRAEMGQGVVTSHAMMVADELAVEPGQIEVLFAPADRVYDNPQLGFQMTGGSTSTKTGWMPVRTAAAVARERLKLAAAAEWGVPVAQLSVEAGEVVHAASKRRATYGALAARAAQTPSPDAKPKERGFTVIGKSTPRLDARTKVLGQAVYGLDVRVPGLVNAVVLRCPVFGGKVKSFDAARAQKVPGFVGAVQIPSGVVVAAEKYWQAREAAKRVKVDFDEGERASVSTELLFERYRQRAQEEKGRRVRDDGDAEAALKRAATVLEAEYSAPFQAHATMEPMNCTAHVRDDAVEVWAGLQGPAAARDIAHGITGVPYDAITVHQCWLGGGFGRRSHFNFVEEAVRASLALKRPVKVIWSREDDLHHDYYRPMAFNRIRGGLTADGKVSGWHHQTVTQSIVGYVGREWAEQILPIGLPLGLRAWTGQRAQNLYGAGSIVDSTSVEGAVDVAYEVRDLAVDWVPAESGIPAGFWRSVGHSHQAFVTESFVDELAHAAKKDPYEFRRGLLTRQHRHRWALEKVAKQSGWGTPAPEGQARGIAVHQSFDSYAAAVAFVSVEDGQIRVRRLVMALDCGRVLNPDGVVMQLESAAMYGLTAALKGEITIEKGRVAQNNFNDYEPLRMFEAPQVEVHLLPNQARPTGVGEPGVPVIAPAVANAVFALTGKRLRSLPLKLA